MCSIEDEECSTIRFLNWDCLAFSQMDLKS